MSRTYRKRPEKFESYYSYCLGPDGWIKDDKEKAQLRAKYRHKTCKYFAYNLPKFFRNSVNKSRRRHDKREIWRALNWHDYAEQCSSWNCKDNNAWGYW